MKRATIRRRSKSSATGATNTKEESKPFFGSNTATPFFQPIIQPKLTVGQPNDHYEAEADRIAAQVTSNIAPTLQKKCTDCEEEKIQRSTTPVSSVTQTGLTASPQVETALQQSAGQGASLPASVKENMEQGFGADFSAVSIHTGADATALNEELNAEAFTVGPDIYFGQGAFDPETSEGKYLLAHELTHVLQQESGAVGVQRRVIPVYETSTERIQTGSVNVGPGITISWNGNAVNINATMEIYGALATPTLASQIQATINSIWNRSFPDGYSVSCNATVTSRAAGAAENSGATQIEIFHDDVNVPSYVQRAWIFGSRYMRYNTAANVSWTPAHEFGHLLGLPDHHSEGVISSLIGGRWGIRRTTTIDAGWQGNIMAADSGVLESKNVQELLAIHATRTTRIVVDTA